MARVEISQQRKDSMLAKLSFVYGAEKAGRILPQILDLIEAYAPKISARLDKTWVDESDVMLITYGDSIQESDKPPLQSLHEFLDRHLQNVLSAVHVLPHYPYSSDDGFSVIDYYAVNPDLGDWEDVQRLAGRFELMFDAVINHISARSEWFREYLKGNPDYAEHFIEADPSLDYSSVTRPRALPLLSPFETANGVKYLWTTFSDDQIDINYRNEKVLLTVLDLLLFYVSKGARFMRLDAIGYLWKELGTSCIHLEQTHKVIQLYREALETLAPQTVLITETNVPHKDNISYFGDGYNEAHMVYQFPLPPLTLNAFHSGNARHLSEWADALEPTTEQTAFFNFLASHDGIGVQPAKDILSEQEVEALCARVREHGGHVSFKNNSDGTQSPYELNINYLDALSHPDDPQDLRVLRFIAAQSILLAMMGMPAIYVHSLLGSRNYPEGVEQTGRFRSINREKLNRQTVEQELETQGTLRHQVFRELTSLIYKRKQEKAFHPNAPQKVLFLGESVFSLLRTSLDGDSRVVVLVNVSNARQAVTLKPDELGLQGAAQFTDLIAERAIGAADTMDLILEPYQVMWLKA